MTPDQEAKLAGMMFDWKAGHTEIQAIFNFIERIIREVQ